MGIREVARSIAKTGLVLLVTNASSFSTVAMEKKIAHYDKNQAAVVNVLNATPGLYDLGYTLGHKVFYNDENFRATAEKQVTDEAALPQSYF